MMNEKLSAMFDGELDDAEAGRLLVRARDGGAERQAWESCALIGDVLRGHTAKGVSERVAERLQAEPVVLAPLPARGTYREMGRWALSAAAGLGAVAMVAWTVFQAPGGELQTAQVPATQVVAPVSVTPQAVDYLIAHQRFSSSSAVQGVAPYVRTVSDQRDAGR